MNERIRTLVEELYGWAQAPEIIGQLAHLLSEFEPPPDQEKKHFFDEKDTVLITYGDMVQADGERPLATLNKFLGQTVQGTIKTVHLLPFYPYSSDDGFSVIDYYAVDSNLGNWEDVQAFNPHFELMFDAVINHISQESDWFHAFLRDEAPYSDYFKVVDPNTDLSAVFRPRALPLLTAVETPSGIKHVWTTFSADQIDLNYESPAVLIEIMKLLLYYVKKRARFIRLDAIGFMWKEVGTRSLHQPQTHAIIQLMRAFLNEVAPDIVLITETNVPHHENISYFGDGQNEAQMVYNFSLPPLTLHAFQTGDASYLSDWAKTLSLPSDQVTFFNFLASHDGIGVTPARGILPDAAIDEMAERVKKAGGFVSYKINSDGSQSAYELNINFLDALSLPEEPLIESCQRFLASQAVMLVLRGVPGIYFHSLFGSRNWLAGVEKTGRNRTINREKLKIDHLQVSLADPQSLRHLIFISYKKMLDIRRQEPAFHPNGSQTILDCHPAVFAVERVALNGRSRIICLQNVSNEPVATSVKAANGEYDDLLESGTVVVENGRLTTTLNPYRICWLKNRRDSN